MLVYAVMVLQLLSVGGTLVFKRGSDSPAILN